MLLLYICLKPGVVSLEIKWPGLEADIYLVPKLRMSETIQLFPLHAFMAKGLYLLPHHFQIKCFNCSCNINDQGPAW